MGSGLLYYFTDCSLLYFPITSHAKSYAMAMFKC